MIYMINFWSSSSKYTLLKGVPIFAIIDGWSFERVCSKLPFPFSTELVELFAETLLLSAQHIPITFGYQYSDKFVLIFSPLEEIEPWFRNDLQNLCSLTSSIITYNFQKLWYKKYQTLEFNGEICFKSEVFPVSNLTAALDLLMSYQEDSLNFFFDSLLLSEMSKEQIKSLSWAEKQKLFSNSNIDVLNYSDNLKLGTCCYKTQISIPSKNGEILRKKWIGNQVISFPKDREFIFQILLNGYVIL